MKNLLKISNLNKKDFALLLELSVKFKNDPYRSISQLQRDPVILYFTHPSTRTRLSFQTAICRLGGTAVVLGRDDLQLGRGETIEDTARVFSQYSRAIIIRTAKDEDMQAFANISSVPFINALSNMHHPCQALTDMLTIKEYFGTLKGIKLAYVGDGNNVVHSLIEAAVLCDIELGIACPSGYLPSSEILDFANNFDINQGNPVKLMNSPESAVQNADVIYTDTWLSMGQNQEEKAERLNVFSNFQITQDLMKLAKPGAVFMHCLPAHRGQEVVSEVIDGPQSIVFKQSENRLYTAQAILYALLNNLLVGKP